MLKTLIKVCLWLLAFVPLIVDTEVFFPFTASKSFYLETWLVLAGILLLINYFSSANFREEISAKVSLYLRNPLVLAVLSFILILIISTVFAVDKYLAFWGELSRAEGLTGLIFFFSFFVFSLLVFEKKDWLWFFKLSLFTALILLGKEFLEFFHEGIDRPASFVGNPTFLAGYLLFAITSAFIIISEEKNIIWKYFSVFVGILSVGGIFIAQTRGTILGLGLGVIGALIFCIYKGKDINYKKFNLRKSAAILILLGIIFSAVFVFTIENTFWQKVPGLSRVAVIGSGEAEDISTPVRFYLYESSLKAIQPSQNGWRKLIIGWGPDNFILADSKYYNASQHKYENKWYDRAHNKLLDVLVMNGVLGLLSYLVLWFFLFFYVLKRKDFSLTNIGLLVFVISFFTHLIFIFDQVSTYVAFFVIITYLIYLSLNNPAKEPKNARMGLKSSEARILSLGAFLVILVVFLNFVFFKNTVPGYLQMRNYTSIIKTQNPVFITQKIDGVFTPFTTAQIDIRRNFLTIAENIYSKNQNDVNLKLLEKAISRAEEYINIRGFDFRFLTTLADFYNKKNVYSLNREYLKKGEEYFKKILAFVPNRPDLNRGLGVNLYNQRRIPESLVYFEKAFDLSPEYFKQDQGVLEDVYIHMVKYFYEQKSKENFIKVATRLKVNNYSNYGSLEKILKYLLETGKWPIVNFN